MIQQRDFGSVERSLNRLLLALKTAKSESMQSTLIKYGYDITHLNEGVKLAEKLHEHIQDQQAWFGEEILLRTKEEQNERSAKAIYEVTRKIAAVAFANMPAAQIALRLNRKHESWKDEAQSFYRTLLDNPALSDRMNSFGYRPIRIKEEAQGVATATRKKHEYPVLKSSHEIDEEVEILFGWMFKFISVLKESDLHHPQFVELYREV